MTNINKLCQSAACSSDEMKLQWIKVDTGFKNIYAGYNGLVCAIKESSMWVRKGVTCENPKGEEWLQYVCDVLKVIPGLQCVVRKSAKKRLHTAKINYEDLVLDWICCPTLNEDSCQGDDTESMHYYACDSKDRLFVVTENGTVSYCDLLCREDLQWNFVTGPPNMDKRGMSLVSWVSRKLWTNSNDSWVGGASFGLDSLWCLKEDGSEVWQLVIGQLNNELRVNWVRSDLLHPNEEEALSLAACKSAKDRLYVIVKSEGRYRLVFYSLKDTGSRTELALPVRSPCRCIAISSTSSVTQKVAKETPNKVCTIMILLVSKKQSFLPVNPSSIEVGMFPVNQSE